jgi:RimJ/RimL family protein N-acetyltransferase
MPLAYCRATSHDVELIRALADRIWHECYPDILPLAQIRYMLGWMYAPHKLMAELAHGAVYECVWHAGAPVGFSAYEFQNQGTVLHLNKLYLVSELHGRGYGQLMLARVLAAAAAGGAGTVELRVNKANARALRAYERCGFSVAEALRQDIGSGFFMDDFVMRRPVSPPAAPR